MNLLTTLLIYFEKLDFKCIAKTLRVRILLSVLVLAKADIRNKSTTEGM